MNLHAAAGRYRDATAGAALALTALIAAGPSAFGPVTVAQPVALTAGGESLLNIPTNLFQDVVDIPSNEVAALNTLAGSLLYTGNWWTPSATNVWGEDPGDPSHFMAVIDLLIPFKEISGLGSPEIDPQAAADGTAGLGQQLALLAAAWLPPSTGCDAISCLPLLPAEPITGITGIDRTLWQLYALANPEVSPLFNGWFRVPLADLLDGYTFPADAVSLSPGVGAGGAVPGDELFGGTGTHLGPDGQNLLPWAGLEFKFNPLGPFENFYNSLLQTPDADGFDLVGPTDIGRAVQAVAAALVVDFNPFVAGSPVCATTCVDLINNAHLSTRDTVQSIADLWPGNPLIDHWLALDAEGLANGATSEQTAATIAGFQTGLITFDQNTIQRFDDALASINPVLPRIFTNAGILTDPAYAGWDGQTPAPEALYGGHDPGALWFDYLQLVDPSGDLEDSLTQAWDGLSDAWNGAFDWL